MTLLGNMKSAIRKGLKCSECCGLFPFTPRKNPCAAFWKGVCLTVLHSYVFRLSRSCAEPRHEICWLSALAAAANTFQKEAEIYTKTGCSRTCCCTSKWPQNCNRNEAKLQPGQHGRRKAKHTALNCWLLVAAVSAAVNVVVAMVDDYDWQAINFGLPKHYQNPPTVGHNKKNEWKEFSCLQARHLARLLNIS